VQISHSHSHGGPVVVDRRLLDALEVVVSEVKRLSGRQLAAEAGMPEDSVGTLQASPPADDEDIEVRILRRQLVDANTAQYALRLVSGTSVTTSEYPEIMSALEMEPSRPASLEISVGRYQGVHLTISIGGWSKGFTYSVSGSAEAINHLRVLLDKALQNSAPNYPWLYRLSTRVLVAFVFALLMMAIYIFVGSLLTKETHPTLHATMLGLFWVYAALVGFVGGSVAERFRMVFPAVEFRFGRGSRETALRALLLWVLGCVAIPVLLLVISLIA